MTRPLSERPGPATMGSMMNSSRRQQIVTELAKLEAGPLEPAAGWLRATRDGEARAGLAQKNGM